MSTNHIHQALLHSTSRGVVANDAFPRGYAREPHSKARRPEFSLDGDFILTTRSSLASCAFHRRNPPRNRPLGERSCFPLSSRCLRWEFSHTQKPWLWRTKRSRARQRRANCCIKSLPILTRRQEAWVSANERANVISEGITAVRFLWVSPCVQFAVGVLALLSSLVAADRFFHCYVALYWRYISRKSALAQASTISSWRATRLSIRPSSFSCRCSTRPTSART